MFFASTKVFLKLASFTSLINLYPVIAVEHHIFLGNVQVHADICQSGNKLDEY